MTIGDQDFSQGCPSYWLYILLGVTQPGSRNTCSNGLRRQEFPPIFLLTWSNILRQANAAVGAPLLLCITRLSFRLPNTPCLPRALAASSNMLSLATIASDMGFSYIQSTTNSFHLHFQPLCVNNNSTLIIPLVFGLFKMMPSFKKLSETEVLTRSSMRTFR